MKPPRKPRNPQSRRARNRGEDTPGAAPATSADTNEMPSSASTPPEPAGEPVAAIAATEIVSAVSAPQGSNEAEGFSASAGTDSGGEGDRSPAPRFFDRRLRAEQIVKDYVPLAVGAGMIPLPGADLAAIGGLQLKVLASLAALYEISFSKSQARLIVTSLLGSVGSTVLVGAALGSVAKFVPIFGTLVGAASMPVAGGVITRALGRLAIDHFEAGGNLETFDLDVAQKAFLDKLAEARAAVA